MSRIVQSAQLKEVSCRKVGFGVIGCGVLPWHINAINSIKNAELKAVCDVSREKAAEFGEKFGVQWFTDPDDMLSSDNVDAVSICTPSGLHAELAEKAFSYGKYVAAEKPLAITEESLSRVLRKQRETGLSLCSILAAVFGRGTESQRDY